MDPVAAATAAAAPLRRQNAALEPAELEISSDDDADPPYPKYNIPDSHITMSTEEVSHYHYFH